MALIGRPYTKQISRSTLQNTVGKMANIKGEPRGKMGVRVDHFDKICSDPRIKGNKHLNRIALNIHKNMKGKGVRDIKMKTHHARQFMKTYGEVVKSMQTEGSNVRMTKFGRKKIMQAPKTGFRRVIEEEVDKQKPEGPSEEQLLGQKRREEAMKNLNRYHRAKEIEKEQGRFTLHHEERDKEKNNKDVQAKNSSDKTPLLSYGSSAMENPQEKRGFGVSSPGLNERESQEKKGSKIASNQPPEKSEKETFEEPPDDGLFE